MTLQTQLEQSLWVMQRAEYYVNAGYGKEWASCLYSRGLLAAVVKDAVRKAVIWLCFVTAL